MNPFFSFRFDLVSGRKTRDVFVIFVATQSVTEEALATCIEHEIDLNLLPDEILIVMREPSFKDAIVLFDGSSLLRGTVARLAKRASLTLLGYSVRGVEGSRQLVHGSKPSKEIRFVDFRRKAMTSIFNSRHGFVESSSTYHFENPSGRHTERFIRLSNILVRGAEIAFVSFCTLPLVSASATIAYIDTPSLYAVIAGINEQRSSFSPKLSPILADNFSSYEGVTDYRFDTGARSFALISASSSGSLAKLLGETHGFAMDRIIHLLFLGEVAPLTTVVCDLAFDTKANPYGLKSNPRVEQSERCRMCAEGSVPIKLQGDQFDIAGPQSSSLLIKKADASIGLSELINRNARQKIFSVGLAPASSKQSDLFHINQKALLESADFQKRLDYVLRRNLPASLSHIVPVDDESTELAKQIEKFALSMGRSVTLVAATDLSQIIGKPETAIVIVAAVIESGRCLLDVSRDLRSIAPKAPLLFLAGFSKCTAEQRRESLGRTLTHTNEPVLHGFVEVEKMTLPVSVERSAWTDELALFQRLIASSSVPSKLLKVLNDRIQRLRQRSLPMLDDLFLPNGATQKLRLQPGFVFWPESVTPDKASHADVFFTIASVLQQLRANAEKPDKPSAIKNNWLQQTLLAPNNFSRFNDDVIQASLLRAALPSEINYSSSRDDSREMARLIKRIIMASETERGGAAAEFLLAIATNRLKLHPHDKNDVLAIDRPRSPMVRLLMDYAGSGEPGA